MPGPGKSGSREDWHRARELYAEGLSYRDIATQLDNRISQATLNRWAVRETWERGIFPKDLVDEETPQIMEQAGAQAVVVSANNERIKAMGERKFIERRIELAQKLANGAEVLFEQMFEAHTMIDVKVAGGVVEVVRVPMSEPSPSDKKHLATTLAILLDKALLLSGEATQRTEMLGTASAAKDRLRFMRDDLAERRNAKAGESSEEQTETG